MEEEGINREINIYGVQSPAYYTGEQNMSRDLSPRRQ